MATSNFLVFNETADGMNDTDYAASSARINGVTPGVADPDLHNKLYRQATIMNAAFGKVMADAGNDALDNDYETLAKNIKSTFFDTAISTTEIDNILV